MANIFDDIRYNEGNALVYKMFIGGKWIKSKNKELIDVTNPANGSLVAKIQSATPDEAVLAVNTAHNAKGAMAEMVATERSKILEKVSELVIENKKVLLETLVKESGKPLKTAEGEVNATAERFKFAAEEAKTIRGEALKADVSPWHRERMGFVIRQPLGVILAITPFNYPLYIPTSKIAPALAAGNTVVVKPASDDPLSMLLLTRLLQEAGVPEGAISVITGNSSKIGGPMIENDKVSMISFTGSSATGKYIASKAGMKKLHLELGGKSPALVLDDADLDVAAEQCVTGALKFSGQRCDSLSRILVMEKVADAFVKKVVQHVPKWKVGDPKEEDTLIGPLINENAIKKVSGLVDDARKKGAKVITGGRVLKGLYYAPTILDNVTTDMRIAWEETFGPVVTIMRVKSYEEAIKIANQSKYGLDASVFTEDLDRALDASMRLEDGTVQINAAPAHGIGSFPFGGDKDSGMDREGIKFSVEDMMRLHSIIFNPRKRD